ncbi:hypothetical protein SAMN05216351_11247 [Pseudobutyrivibrio sp. JW11]|uniref:hypothetical protein n=1 Tax=Pseudobutyrivibrio sp. JW11 TaxID=1855302 RepID=UPI0008DF7E8C|nr:hypothetical protein [Pseudobutyrivibrio sp. JW11]SFO49438.1 hypothetical protein SAMN05216351_11247 [Pseudobutyrivibrio sp. JW11]
MFDLFFIVPVVIVAGVWLFILVNVGSNSKSILRDDIACADRNTEDAAKKSLRIVRIMGAVWAVVVAAIVIYFMNSHSLFFEFEEGDLFLLLMGIFFTVLGFALGRVFSVSKNSSQDKDLKLVGNIFMISFMGAGIIMLAIVAVNCVQLPG